MRQHGLLTSRCLIVLACTISLLLLLQCTLTQAAPVITFTDSTITSLPTSHPDHTYLVKFTAPWCGHCKHLAPVFEEAASQLGSTSKLQLGDIDCTKYSSTCKQYNVNGYPTLKVIRNGAAHDWQDDRSMQSIMRFGDRLKQPAVHLLKSVSELDALHSHDRQHNIIALFDDSTSSQTSKLFSEYATSQLMSQTKYVQLPLKAAKDVKQLQLDGHLPSTPFLTAVTYGEGTYQQYDATELTHSQLHDFISTNEQPLIYTMSQQTYDSILHSPPGGDVPNRGHVKFRYAVLVFVDPAATTANEQYISTLFPVATRVKPYMTMAVVDRKKYHTYAKGFGIQPDSKDTHPKAVVYDAGYESYYTPVRSNLTAHDTTMSANDLHHWLGMIIRGQLRSESLLPWYNPRRYYHDVMWYYQQVSPVVKATALFVLIIIALGITYKIANAFGWLDEKPKPTVRSRPQQPRRTAAADAITARTKPTPLHNTDDNAEQITATIVGGSTLRQRGTAKVDPVT